MHITAHLDVDLVAVETEDEVSVLVELTAPGAAPGAAPDVRPHLARTLQVVLDRSGSMAASGSAVRSRHFCPLWTVSTRPTTSGWSPSTTTFRSPWRPAR